MTADEVLKQMQNSIYMQSNEQVYCAINPETRTIEIPDDTVSTNTNCCSKIPLSTSESSFTLIHLVNLIPKSSDSSIGPIVGVSPTV